MKGMRRANMIRLINLDEGVLDLIEHDLASFEAGFNVTAGASAAIVKDIARQSRRLFEHRGEAARWGAYLAADGDSKQIVGVCGFAGSPSPHGDVEIAYSTFEPYEGRGYATDMGRSLLAAARSAPEVRCVLAHTLPQETASTTILRKLGMHLDGEVNAPGLEAVMNYERGVAQND